MTVGTEFDVLQLIYLCDNLLRLRLIKFKLNGDALMGSSLIQGVAVSWLPPLELYELPRLIEVLPFPNLPCDELVI